jgi:hypothetical protein
LRLNLICKIHQLPNKNNIRARKKQFSQHNNNKKKKKSFLFVCKRTQVDDKRIEKFKGGKTKRRKEVSVAVGFRDNHVPVLLF